MSRLLFLFQALYAHRRLIWQLTVHDLRSRYAATLAGSIWAVINPMVVILVFWFVSAYGLRLTFETGPPFFLVLFCGLIPWMTFSEALMSGAGAVLNHQYLVKRTAFPLEILPIVSLASALIVHGCLVVLLIIILLVSGVHPTLHFLQAIYFLIAMSAFIAGLAWLFAALNVFNRDVSQALGATMTIWFWITPIVWPVQNVSGSALWLIQLNPVFYVVEGYRNAFLYSRPLSALWPLDLYFWGVTASLFLLGAAVFQRLKPHFADVL
jgi:ABC-type polysaccharide/polyol phosphate export permease